MNGIVSGVKTFFTQHPAADSLVRHFLTTFAATFLVAEFGLLKTVDVAHFHPSTLVASEVALVLAAGAAAVRAIVPLVVTMVTPKKQTAA